MAVVKQRSSRRHLKASSLRSVTTIFTECQSTVNRRYRYGPVQCFAGLCGFVMSSAGVLCEEFAGAGPRSSFRRTHTRLHRRRYMMRTACRKEASVVGLALVALVT